MSTIINLASGESVEHSLDCNDAVTQFSARATPAGKVRLSVQSSQNGRNFGSYHRSVTLDSKTTVVNFGALPPRTRVLRLWLENASGSAAHVEIDDEATQDQPTPEIVSGTSAESASN
ncbi:MAG TPA: hypothetical protein VGF98_01110 [Candidatus Tumulicola sp.]|jgi:hypothetical protein